MPQLVLSQLRVSHRAKDRSGVRLPFCLSVFPTIRPPHASAAGLLLSVVPAGDMRGRQRRLPGTQQQQHSAQREWHLAANASSVTLTADV